MVSVTDRAIVSAYGATVYASSPGPVCVAVEIAIHEGIPVAIQVHPAAVLTDNELERPLAFTITLEGITM